MGPDMHKIHCPQSLLTHPMPLVLSVDTAVLMTTIAAVVKYGGYSQVVNNTPFLIPLDQLLPVICLTIIILHNCTVPTN